MLDKTNPEDDLFEEALLKAAGPERAAFLEGACRNDHELRARVEIMIDGHLHADGFLQTLPERTPPSHGTLTETTSLEQLGSSIGPYKLLEKIGEGGCGVVYVAEQEKPVRRRVALKIIKLGMDTRAVIARFEAERQALAIMDHPNIARVLDAGATGAGRPYFVMELVKGIRITDYCDQYELTTGARLDLFTQVCHAIQHAHQKGIIHRDIKPSNVLVTSHDGVPVPRVIDFGIAKATQERLTDLTIYTELNQFIGTPAYMSPEQAEMSGLDLDTRTDIYALGVLLYELLTGTTPFDGRELLAAGLDAMRRTIREVDPVQPSTRLTQLQSAKGDGNREAKSSILNLKSSIDHDLDWIVMKCLEKDRTRRYETANGLAADLKRHLNNEPVVARPASVAYRLQKAFRRNKVVFSAATAVAVALLTGLGVSTWQAVEARTAERATEVARKGEQQQRLEAQSAQKAADAQALKASASEQHSRRLLYAADMNLAQQTLKLNNLGRARRLLERHRPQDGGEDLRGWEWRYLWQLTRSSALDTLTNRPVRGFSVSFSPDGTRLAVGWMGGLVDLWDVPRRLLVQSLTEREYSHPGRVAFSPVRNLLAATSKPNVVTLYDLDSGQESILWQAPDPAEGEVRDLAFAQDGSKVVIYAGSPPSGIAESIPERGDAVWVVNVSSSQVESRHPTLSSKHRHFGAAQLSADNRRLYLARSDFLKHRYSIQCIDLTTGQELWETEPQRDVGLSTLASSPDGRVLASGSGYEDPAIRLWDAATGRLLRQLDGHTSWVCKLAFTRDGRRLISAAGDQSIRFWDTSDLDTGNWTDTQVLRGHTDEVHAVAMADAAQLVASASKDGNLMLWNVDGKSAADGYSRLPENVAWNQVHPLDHSRVLLLQPGRPIELVDLKRDSPPVSLFEIGSSNDVLGCFGANILCQWNGTNQILIRELLGKEFIERGAVTLDSGLRPTGLTYNATRQLLAWSEGSSSTSICLASLGAAGRRSELKSDVPGLVPRLFSEDGNYLAAWKFEHNLLHVWDVATRQVVVSINNQGVHSPAFAAGGRVLVLAINQGNDHEIVFHDLVHPDKAARRVPGKETVWSLAVSPDGGLVAAPTAGGQVRLFDSAKGELIESLHGHLNSVGSVAFSKDGRRLISTSGGREAVKVWDVGTRQELLTLIGTGSVGAGRWSADGDVILAGPPWQAWRAPSWEEIAAAEKATEGKSQQPSVN